MPPVRIRYQTLEIGALDVHVRTLRDAQQFDDADGEAERLGISSAIWPLFGVVWDSSVTLARMMLEHPVTDLRILEVGCGIGLASLVLNHRNADITATDHHPEASAFLQANATLNGDGPIPFLRADWADEHHDLGTFDLIIGSDVLYETGQVETLSRFIRDHAREQCEVIIVDPGRGESRRFDRAMEALGFEGSRRQEASSGLTGKPFRADVLTYIR